MVEGEGLSAPGAEADVAAQLVKEDLIDLVGHPLPAVIEPVLVHRALEGLGEGEVQIQLPVVQLQLGEGGLPLGQAGLLQLLPLLPAAEELVCALLYILQQVSLSRIHFLS